MITALNSFASALREIAGPDDRPFVCDGSPLECNVFLVGANPATALTRSFWDFWDDESGFDKAAWFRQYLDDRAKAPLRPGKTRRNAVSNTRRRLDWLAEETAPARCLETNVYSGASEETSLLHEDQKSSIAFDYLVNFIRPRVILAHGEDAIRHMEALTGQAIDKGVELRCAHGDARFELVAVPHLARGWSQARVRELGKRLHRMALRTQ